MITWLRWNIYKPIKWHINKLRLIRQTERLYFGKSVITDYFEVILIRDVPEKDRYYGNVHIPYREAYVRPKIDLAPYFNVEQIVNPSTWEVAKMNLEVSAVFIGPYETIEDMLFFSTHNQLDY